MLRESSIGGLLRFVACYQSQSAYDDLEQYCLEVDVFDRYYRIPCCGPVRKGAANLVSWQCNAFINEGL